MEIKMTSARRFTLDELQNAGTHLTAIQIHEKLKDKLPSLNLSTVYRTLDYLVEAIDFQSSKPGVSRLERAIQGIASLEPKSQPITERITKLAQEHEQAERKTRQELESNYRELLHQLRISGTAVGDINLEATPEWQPAQQGLAELFRPRLDSLKQELTCIFELMC